MKRGDIWIVDLNPAVGGEIRNINPRPVMIVSTAAFCQVTRMAVIVPITGGGMASRNAGYAVPLMGFGLKTTGAARCEQMRSVDLSARGAVYVETASDILVDQILGILDSMFA
jgi:mRNA interferase ChpB